MEIKRTSNTARFFHRFVCRVGGMPMEALEGLRGRSSGERLDRVLALEDELTALAEPLADALHKRIGGHTDKVRRQGLIELRRRVFNRRPIDAAVLDSLATDLEADGLAGRLDAFHRLQNRLTLERAAFAEAFEADTLEGRRHLRAAASEEDFVGALLLSSPVLEQARDRTLRRPLERPRAKDRRIERGLLRYLTRAAAKATPFATFCAILPGEIVEADASVLDGATMGFVGDPLTKRGMVRLNKAFLTVAQRHLVRDPVSRRYLEATINPTLRRDADKGLVFLSLASGREVFQRLAPNPALEQLTERLEGRGMSAHDLICEMVDDPEIEADADTLSAYIDRLIEIGFLQLGTGVPAQSLEWNQHFCRSLEGVDHPRVIEVREWLASLEKQAQDFAAAPRAQRAAGLATLRSTVQVFGKTHGLDIQMNAQIFEDSTADARAILRRDPGLEKMLTRFVEITGRATELRRDQAQLRHFFDTHYGAEVEAVPLLDLYQDYYREHYKAHLERQAGEKGEEGYDLANPFGLDLVARIETAREALAEHLADGWAATAPSPEATLHVTLDELLEAVRDVDPLPDTSGWSVSFFGEVIPSPAGGPLRMAVQRGRYTTGFGKMFSRFLDLFPEDFAEELRSRNDAGGRPGDLPAELCDDANFNANLHPPLFSTEISYPPGEKRREGSSLLPTVIDVVRNPRDPHMLELRHQGSGRRVTPVDTGIMNPSARPPLYQLLSTFTPTTSAVIAMPLGLGPHAPENGEVDVVVRPRVVVEDRLILYRRAFLVPHQVYPQRDDRERDTEYLERVERWRRSHGIPKQVYVRFGHPIGLPREAAQGPEDPLGPEWMKPQWIDFTSPLLVDLFGRMAPPRTFLATLEECLPEPAMRPEHEGQTLAAEWILQLDFGTSTEG